MDNIVCNNIFVSDNETTRCQSFNEIWLVIVNMMLNK